MTKKVLILGGAGFIGLGIARFLGETRDYDITIADLFTREKIGNGDVVVSRFSKKPRYAQSDETCSS